MARKLGEAFVEVSPDTRGFGEKLKLGIKKAMTGVDTPNLPIEAKLDIKPALLQASELTRRIKELIGDSVTIPVKLKDTEAQASILGLRARLQELYDYIDRKTSFGAKILSRSDEYRILAEIASIQARFDRLRESAEKPIEIKVRGISGGLLGKLIGVGAGGDAGGRPSQLSRTITSLAPGGAQLTGQAWQGIGIASVGALSVGFGGLIPLILAATAGIGSFGLLASTTLSDLQTALGAVSTATDAYVTASQNLNTAINQSPADLAAYNAVLKGLEPDLASAATLLTNTSVTWQTLTPVQQKSVIALRNNAAAYKTLLPSQKDALNALIKEGNAWNTLSPAQQTAGLAIGKLDTAFSNMQDALAPITFKVFNAGLKIANDLLPFLAPLATSAGNALAGLLGNLDNFINGPPPKPKNLLPTPTGGPATGAAGVAAFTKALPPPAQASGFKAFVDNLTKLSGPAITAIGEGLGKVAVALGKLILAMESPDALVLLNGTFRILAGTIAFVAKAFVVGTPVMIAVLHNINNAVKGMVTFVAGVFKTFGDLITGHWSAAWHEVLDTGKKLWTLILNSATEVVTELHKAWDDLVPASTRKKISTTFDLIRHDIAAHWDEVMSNTIDVWNKIWTETLGRATQWVKDVEGVIGDLVKWIALSFDIVKNEIGIVWDKIELIFLNGVKFIVDLMAKLPGPLGAPFKAARTAIDGTMTGLQQDIGQRTKQIQSDIDSIHGKSFTLKAIAEGQGGVSVVAAGLAAKEIALSTKMAGGGQIRGGTPGKDSVLGMLMPGEVVVPTHMVNAGAVDHLKGKLPGFASGGIVGFDNRVGSAVASDVAPILAADVKAEVAAVKAEILNALLFGGGPAIVRYARSFLGKIPYVFGGNSLSNGIDCSGFTQQVYGHFGIHAPRTSESQFGWATKSGPVPGGLAFYVSPAGGPPPGHVAIVQDRNSVISQGGGMGPTIESIGFLPLMGTGVPKGGFPASTGGGGNNAIGGGSVQQIAMALLRQFGWSGQWPAFNSLETREAGWSLTATNPSSGAYGLAQFINGPSEYYQYGGNPNTAQGQLLAMMNYISNRYGATNGPNNAWAHEVAFNWYGQGGLAGYASGVKLPPTPPRKKPTTTSGGPAAVAAYRKVLAAEQKKEGETYLGFRRAILHSPAKLRTKRVRDELETLFHRQGAEQEAYKHLKGAGLTVKNLDKLEAAAKAEYTTAGDLALKRLHPGWSKNLRIWLSRLSATAQKGLPGGQQTSGPGGSGLPAITHTYGGDVANTIGAYLQSQISPFGVAKGGMIFDRGGWLRPGWNATYNGTGKPEHLVPSSGSSGAPVVITIGSTGNTTFDQVMLAWVKKAVKVHGGGNVQKAFGAH